MPGTRIQGIFAAAPSGKLNNEITAKRNVKFYAFSLVEAEGVDFYNSRARQMNWLIEQGFEVVEFQEVTQDTVEAEVLKFSEKIAQNDFPSDGLVLVYDDIAYGQSRAGHPSFQGIVCLF